MFSTSLCIHTVHVYGYSHTRQGTWRGSGRTLNRNLREASLHLWVRFDVWSSGVLVEVKHVELLVKSPPVRLGLEQSKL